MFTKVVILLSAVLATTLAQRPPYAGSNFGRPDLASRFKKTEESTTMSFDNRVGSDGSTIRIPTDARGDVNLVNTLNQWPREHRPFWLLNAEHIERQRHPDEPYNNFGTKQQQLDSEEPFHKFETDQEELNPDETFHNFGTKQQEFEEPNVFDNDDYQYDNHGYNQFEPSGPINIGSRSDYRRYDDVPSRNLRPSSDRGWVFGRS